MLLTRDGQPKITDLGLAKCLAGPGQLTESGVIMDTPSYMAPEQAAGQSRDVGPATDVHALGAILYDLAAEAQAKHRSTAPKPPTGDTPKRPRGRPRKQKDG